MKPKTLRSLAIAAGRAHTLPEDVGESLASGRTVAQVQQELLEFLGGLLTKQGFGGADDYSLCCFVAAEAGRERKGK